MSPRELIKRLNDLESRVAALEAQVQDVTNHAASTIVAKEIDDRLQSIEDWRKTREQSSWRNGSNRRG